MDLLTANDTPGRYPDSFYAAKPGLIPPARPPAEGEIRADVAVVGGGFTGLSAAWHLAGRGYDVVLLEASRVGAGASGRNGGQVGTGQRVGQDALERMVGRDDALALWAMGREAVRLVRETAERPEVGVPFHPGIVHADHKRAHVRETHAYVEKLARDYGYEKMRPLSKSGIREIVASRDYHGGALDEGAGHLDPLAYALGLARLAEAAGVRLFETSRVTRVERGAEVRLSTDRAVVRADWVVAGCNGYLGGLIPEVGRHVMPINNFVVATEPLGPEGQEALIAGNRAVADSRFVVNYFRFSDDHRLLFGGGETYGYRFPRDIAALVRRPMLKVFPQLAGTRIDFAWGGTLAITRTRMPHFARVAPNVLSLSGYSGHGVGMATLAGQVAAETIAGQAERFDLMGRLPAPRFPGGRALRTPLLALAMAWFSLRDRL
ncbi:FAD-binding oxidoreductase [Rhodovulum sp. 12E13]|uniref:NAD(P)/FAD-dependent oxidoreductase n=1 Tax=Rhodovulum sp. 12E13 TaxID=2203891 RepID=UPI000E1516D6|nr:FAD-binding oxidoreductase [Rhodovulum sp. 12E13]RDC74494.1 FAD-binding oxidoreductase [Rhodovulum sp. 12E13]